MRAAIYFVPPADAALTKAAALWLGRDPYGRMPARAPDPIVDPLVREPARYGFHATLKAPFRLAQGADLGALEDALGAFASERACFMLPALSIVRIGGFFALAPGGASPSLALLERDVLHGFEPFRAPLSEAETARRRPHLLTGRQRQYLDEWGYPYVLDEFRFHMTLTGEVQAAEAAVVEALLHEHFADFVHAPLAIDGLAIFVEPEAGAPFRVHARHSFQPAFSSVPAGAPS